MYRIAADIILVLHFAFVLFILGGFVLVWLGYIFCWEWVRNFRFRMAHLGAMGFVLLESLIGMVCPLTEWESRLRQAAGNEAYETSFMQYWIHKMLFFDIPLWVFSVGYAAFFLLLVLSFFLVPPIRR